MAAADPTASERRATLAKLPLFEGLAARELDALFAATTTKRLAAHQVLFEAGEAGSSLHAVIRGRLEVSVSDAEGRRVVLNLMGPGDVIGEIALLDGSPRSATVTALEPCVLLSLQRRDLLPVLQRNPAVSMQLAMVLAGRLRRLSALTGAARFLNLPARLSRQLLELARRHGRATPAGLRIDVRIPQAELGEMVRTSRESVNKQLRAWVAEGTITVERGIITVRDPDALEELAGLLRA